MCVHVSKAFVMFYTAVIAVLGFHIYKLVQERGKAAATLASLELGKQTLLHVQKDADKVM